MGTGYGQFCPIAKASEIFATRWTPLILRELMADSHSFNDIQRGLPLISRAVLVARLRELEDHGVIERRPRAAGAGLEYWLTPAGEALRPVVGTLAQWGLVHTREWIKPADLDPAELLWGFRRRADRTALPNCRVVVRFEFSGVPASRTKFRVHVARARALRGGRVRQGSRVHRGRSVSRKHRRFCRGLSRSRSLAYARHATMSSCVTPS